MNLYWYCPSCASVRGPLPINVCPVCGVADMLFVRKAEETTQQKEDSQVDVGSDIPGGGAT